MFLTEILNILYNHPIVFVIAILFSYLFVIWVNLIVKITKDFILIYPLYLKFKDVSDIMEIYWAHWGYFDKYEVLKYSCPHFTRHFSHWPNSREHQPLQIIQWNCITMKFYLKLIGYYEWPHSTNLTFTITHYFI